MNIHLLIEAYKQIPERNLVVVSNWNISDYGIKLKFDNYEKYPNIFLQDAVYDLDYLNVIRGNGEIYFHTHSLCGTAPSLVEAMNIGLPIICFDVETNRSTTEEKSFYFGDVESLIIILKHLRKNDLVKLGHDMRRIAQNRYNWKRIVTLYKKCIE
jgi:glycosyltransferase involved in cell wall biosynthesis